MHTFKARISIPYVALYVLLALALVAIVVNELQSGSKWPDVLLPFVILVCLSYFPLSYIMARTYTLSDSLLSIRHGAVQMALDMGTITAVTPERAAFPNPLSPLPPSRLRIDFTLGGAQRVVRVAPAEQEVFVAELEKRRHAVA